MILGTENCSLPCVALYFLNIFFMEAPWRRLGVAGGEGRKTKSGNHDEENDSGDET